MTVPQTRQAAAESLLGEIQWKDATTGFCRCPGIDLHTTANGPKHTIVYVAGLPCFRPSPRLSLYDPDALLKWLKDSYAVAAKPSSYRPRITKSV